MKFHKQVLDNGLTIIAECNEEAHSAAVGFFVHTGSRDESPQLWGVSHFLEHMAFKGTPTRDVDDVNREFDEIGSHPNAYTTDENTVYYAAVLPEYAGRCVELLADLLRPALRDEDFDTEKQVIIEEIQMYDDQPPFGADDLLKEKFFGQHPLARSVIGTEESVGALTVDQMRGYFQTRYSPQHLTLSATGKVDFKELVALAEKYCGKWSGSASQRVRGPAQPQTGFHVVHKPSATQEYVVQYALGPGICDEDVFAAKLLATILGDDSGSRLYWDLVDPGLVDHAACYHHGFEDCGIFGTSMSCRPEQTAENLQLILDIYRQAEQSGLTEEEFKRAQSKLSAHIVLGGERPLRRLYAVGTVWQQRGEYRSVKDDIEEVAAVTLDDVEAVLRRYPLTQCMTMCIGPAEEVAEPN